VTWTEYVPGCRLSRAVPAALVSPQRSCSPATVNAHTLAPDTGAPAGALTMTASVRTGVGVGVAATGGVGWHATSVTARSVSATRGGRINLPMVA